MTLSRCGWIIFLIQKKSKMSTPEVTAKKIREVTAKKIREYLLNKYDSPQLREKIANNIVFLRKKRK